MVWCLETAPRWLPKCTATSAAARHHFTKSPAAFTRWLFKRACKRSDVQSASVVVQSTLVVGWREAKPCLQALVASLTGETEGLRPDNRRQVSAPGSPGRRAPRQWCMIVLADTHQTLRAERWAGENAGAIDILVADDVQALMQAIGERCPSSPLLKAEPDALAPAPQAATADTDELKVHACRPAREALEPRVVPLPLKVVEAGIMRELEPVSVQADIMRDLEPLSVQAPTLLACAPHALPLKPMRPPPGLESLCGPEDCAVRALPHYRLQHPGGVERCAVRVLPPPGLEPPDMLKDISELAAQIEFLTASFTSNMLINNFENPSVLPGFEASSVY